PPRQLYAQNNEVSCTYHGRASASSFFPPFCAESWFAPTAWYDYASKLFFSPSTQASNRCSMRSGANSFMAASRSFLLGRLPLGAGPSRISLMGRPFFPACSSSSAARAASRALVPPASTTRPPHMDQQLASLFAAWWTSASPDAARGL